MSDTRIAVLLYGHLRTYKQCAPSLMDNICTPLKADVFLHTWDEFDSKTRAWYPEDWKISGEGAEDFHDYIKRLYRPVSFEVDAPLDFDHKKDEFLLDCEGKSRINLNGLLSCLTSLNRAMQLLAETESVKGVKYQKIIVTRPDIFFGPSVQNFFKEEITKFDKESLNCGYLSIDNFEVGSRTFVRKTAFDVLFWGCPHIVKRFTDMVKSFEGWAENSESEIGRLFDIGVFWPEVIYERYLASKGVYLMPHKVEFSIQRKSHAPQDRFRKLLSRTNWF